MTHQISDTMAASYFGGTSGQVFPVDSSMDTRPAAGGDMIEPQAERYTPGTPIDNDTRDCPVFIDQLLFYATQPCNYILNS